MRMDACAVNHDAERTLILDDRTFAACRQGDREAFRRLFEAYKDRVYSVAIYFLNGDTATAEDISQDVFVRVYTRLAQFRCEAEFMTWLYRLTANACMDEFRRRKRQPATMSENVSAWAAVAGGDEVFTRLEISISVRVALNNLPPDMRLTVLLRYFEGMSYEEIARILHCSEGTVASRLSRSLKALARKLAHLQETDEKEEAW